MTHLCERDGASDGEPRPCKGRETEQPHRCGSAGLVDGCKLGPLQEVYRGSAMRGPRAPVPSIPEANKQVPRVTCITMSEHI